ncbi:hypothetical protein BO86DRAFT_127012 [Aspergillus japonicus CBS 114.51]|uniref:Mid2 domain-containing protein n=2 Tax=Aspergillus TaxID=5052 RepID=A0A2V5HJB6_ASPV1|nr:hypothetical protein BO86DRAFT_127012 [Aspergillus japonicus CBS 114.51]PYI16210.1 hypothetical protein BO99DRAFT_415239 [Aspergillus violaceofuscus CBS 115571]RAH80495.1 hypothetical protein BO86DRAFT_127012 [Aspergillus japonicus CBS 114.51]
MQLRYLIALGTLSSLAAAHPGPAADLPSTWAPTSTVTVTVPVATQTADVNNLKAHAKRFHGDWVIQKRASTTEETSSTTSESTTSTSSTSTTSTTESTTSTTSTTSSSTTEATTSSTTSTVSSTTSTASSTTSSSTTTSATSQSTTTAATTTTKTTSTASTTTSTASATNSASAAKAAYNRRGEIAAIVTFTILILLFIGVAAFMCTRDKRKRRRIEARAAAKAADYSMVSLTEGARPQSEAKFDRASVMFATAPSRSELGLSTPLTRPSSIATSEVLRQSPTPAAAPDTPPEAQHRAGNFV